MGGFFRGFFCRLIAADLGGHADKPLMDRGGTDSRGRGAYGLAFCLGAGTGTGTAGGLHTQLVG